MSEPKGFLYRARRYSVNGRWFTWYEACPVIRHSSKRIVVVSQDFPNSKLYPGGEFQIDRHSIVTTGKAYHSRHGEYFYLDKPEQGDLFPSQDVVSTASALELEAKAIGWDLQNLSDEQLEAYVFAIKNGVSLTRAFES